MAGGPELLEAIRKCQDSLHAERVVAYREAAGVDHGAVRMAVVVQRMVDAATAGVMFTADPLTGTRTDVVVDAAAGPGAAVVDGAVEPDHYVLNGAEPESRGCLTRAQLAELRTVGLRLQEHFGGPQDIEWAIDSDGALWLLQSRPITTLFPLPPEDGKPGPRVYLEFGHVQGMLQPVTPMGMSALKAILAGMFRSFGVTVEIVDIGGRLYGDLTDLMRGKATRKRLVKLMAVDFGPRAQAVIEHLMGDPRFAPVSERPAGAQQALGPALRTARARAGRSPGRARPPGRGARQSVP